MGASPLLTVGVDIAKRIEARQLLHAESATPPIVIDRFWPLAGFETRLRSLKNRSLHEEEVPRRSYRSAEDITPHAQLHKHYKTVRRLAGQLATVPRKERTHTAAAVPAGREIVRSLIIATWFYPLSASA
jgi:hypothetical protein